MSTIKAYTLQEHFYDIFCDALRPLKAYVDYFDMLYREILAR